MIVSIDGLDASGKHTQAIRLAQRLAGKVFSFPNYSSKTGQLIEGHLKGRWRITREGVKDTTLDDYTYYPKDDNALVLQCLFFANRMESTLEIVEAAKAQNVVLDRYDASIFAYGAADGIDPIWLTDISHHLRVQPRLRIYLDISPEESFARRPDRRDRYEQDAKYLDRVRLEFLRLFTRKIESGEKGWVIVDGSGTADDVADRIWSVASAA